jgi:nitrite reductase/ring-hydroxylating ferredoxin subunit
MDVPGTGGVSASRMPKHVVAEVAEIPAGGRKAVLVKGRPIVIFNLGGEFFGLLDRCPHQSAELSRGMVSGIAISDEPGVATCSRPGEFIRCPWHGWEFDIRTGQSWTDPSRIKVRPIPVNVEAGCALVQGPFKAETISVQVDGAYVVVDI